MKLTIEIDDADVAQLMAQQPARSLTEIIGELVSNAVTACSKSTLELREKKQEDAETFAAELVTYLLANKPEGKFFSSILEARDLFGSRLPPNDRALHSAICIQFGRECRTHRELAASGTRVIVDTTLARGARFRVEIKP